MKEKFGIEKAIDYFEEIEIYKSEIIKDLPEEEELQFIAKENGWTYAEDHIYLRQSTLANHSN